MEFKRKVLDGMLARGKAAQKRRAASTADGPVTLEGMTKVAGEMRKGMKFLESVVMMMTAVPLDVKHEKIVKVGVNVDQFIPQKPNDKAILYIHGGGWVVGQSRVYLNFCAQLARTTNAKVFAVDYRLAPEHPFPAGLDDVFAVYQALIKDGFDPKKIVVMGDSAGGNLTLALIHKLKDEKQPLPGAAIPLSALTDFNQSTESYVKRAEIDPMLGASSPRSKEGLHLAYLRGTSPDHHLASPLLGDLKGFPPLLIMVGGREVLHDDSVLFYEKAKKAGVDATLDVEEDMFHVYPVFHDIMDEAKVALGKIALFIQMKT